MSNYSQIVSYGPKDNLSPGDPNKVIKGVQIDAELAAIQSAIATKYDSVQQPVSLALGGTTTLQIASSSGENKIQGLGPLAGSFLDMTPDQKNFTATYSGFVSPPSGSCTVFSLGLLTALVIGPFSGTSNANTFAMTNMVGGFMPGATTQLIACPAFGFTDNSAILNQEVCAQVITGGTSIAFWKGTSATGWTASGTKGINQTITLWYVRT